MYSKLCLVAVVAAAGMTLDIAATLAHPGHEPGAIAGHNHIADALAALAALGVLAVIAAAGRKMIVRRRHDQ